MAQATAVFARCAQRAARHGARCPPRTRERFAIQNQTTTDSGADSDIEELFERLPRAEHGLRQRRGPHISFDDGRGKLRQSPLNRQTFPGNAILTDDISVQVHQFANAEADARHALIVACRRAVEVFAQTQNISKDRLSASGGRRENLSPGLDFSRRETDQTSGDFGSTHIDADRAKVGARCGRRGKRTHDFVANAAAAARSRNTRTLGCPWRKEAGHWSVRAPSIMVLTAEALRE